MDYREALLGQEVVYEQFQDSTPQDVAPQATIDDGGAITNLSSNTLVVGGKTGAVQNIEAPQPLGTGADVTFNTVDFGDAPTTRTNLGLGGLSTQDPGVAVANLAGSISNPPTQAEVQAIQNKVNELLDSLRDAGIIAT